MRYRLRISRILGRCVRIEALEQRRLLAAAGLVAAYGFDDGGVSTVSDLSGNNNNGTISGATWVAAGKYGGALSFDGTNDSVSVPDAANLDLTDGMTLEAWVNPTAINGWETVILKEAGSNLAYALYADNNGNDSGGPRRPAAWMRQGSASYSSNGTAQLALNQWTHLAATYDGSALRLYAGGTLASTLNRTGSINISSGALRIGGNTLWSEWFNGLIDEVMIYNRALSQAEIQADMNTPVTVGPDTTPPTITAQSPVAGATGVAATANVTVTFSEAMDAGTIDGSTLELLRSSGAPVAASISYNASTHTATLDPIGTLKPGGAYAVLVHGGAADPRVKDLAGNALAANAMWKIKVAPLAVSVSDAVVVEGNSGSANAVFNVSLSAPVAWPVSVTGATADGSATAGQDYTAVEPYVLTFDPGQTSETITVAVHGDTAEEGNELFFINLSAPVNAVLGDAQGIGTISDDDGVLIGSEGFGYSAYTSAFENVDLVPGAADVFTIRASGNNNADLLTLTGSNRFNYYGTSYASFYVSTNGMISFGTTNTAASNTDLTSAPSQAVIAPLWDDWVNVSGEAMLLGRYDDISGDGTPDRLIIEWNNVQGNTSSPSPITFQAILQLNTGTTAGPFSFNYPDLDASNTQSSGGSATVGIKDTGAQGTRTLLVSLNSAASPYVGSGRAITFKPDAVPPSVSLTAPADGSTITGTLSVTAIAADNVAVAGVQFLLDGVPLGAEDTSAPYSIAWNTGGVTSGPHTLAARSRDPAGNASTSDLVSVTVTNINDPALVGQWSSVTSWPLVAMNAVLLADGRVLAWDGGPDCIGSTSPHVWDPTTGTFTPVPMPYFTGRDDDLFCSAQVLMADGRVLVVGGHDCDGPQLGIKMVNIFDPVTMTWTRGPDMAYRRWYPTATTLSDGRVLVTAGSVNNTTDYVPIPEIYNPVTNAWTTLTAANRTIPNYPFVFQSPDGRVLVAGSDEAKMASYELDVAAQTWRVVDSTVLDAGSAVMYLPGKVMKAGSSYLSPPADNGGSVPSSALTYGLDDTAPVPAWQQTASMANPRTHLNLTMLPDGDVLATGGSRDIGGVNPASAVYTAELWSPQTQTWRTLANAARPRMYHSTALLLPDGRVLSAGGGHNYFNNHAEFNAEIYSPPYLFRGARPMISSAPAALTYGSSFFIGTPDGASIASVALVRNGSVTHAFNMDQRFIPLSFQVTSGGLTVQAPADGRTAPPGHYMLFLVNGNGVPSIAPFISIAPDLQPPAAPANATAIGGGGNITVDWNAAADNVAVVRYHIHRSMTAGFVPSAANRIGQSIGTSYLDEGLAAGTYYYTVMAEDGAGNISAPSNEAMFTLVQPIQLVENVASGFEFSTNSISLAFPSSNIASDFLILTGTAARPAQTITIFDTAGNTDVPAVEAVTDPVRDVTACIGYVVAARGGPNMVMLRPGAGAGHAMEIHLSEWMVIDKIPPLDHPGGAETRRR